MFLVHCPLIELLTLEIWSRTENKFNESRSDIQQGTLAYSRGMYQVRSDNYLQAPNVKFISYLSIIVRRKRAEKSFDCKCLMLSQIEWRGRDWRIMKKTEGWNVAKRESEISKGRCKHFSDWISKNCHFKVPIRCFTEGLHQYEFTIFIAKLEQSFKKRADMKKVRETQRASSHVAMQPDMLWCSLWILRMASLFCYKAAL